MAKTTKEHEAAFRKDLAALLKKYDAYLEVEIIRGDAYTTIKAEAHAKYEDGEMVVPELSADLGGYCHHDILELDQ